MLSALEHKKLTCQGPPGGHCRCLRCSHPLRPSLADRASQDQRAGWWDGSTRTWVAEHVYYTTSSVPTGTGLQQLSFTASIEANSLSELVPDNVCAGMVDRQREGTSLLTLTASNARIAWESHARGTYEGAILPRCDQYSTLVCSKLVRLDQGSDALTTWLKRRAWGCKTTQAAGQSLRLYSCAKARVVS